MRAFLEPYCYEVLCLERLDTSLEKDYDLFVLPKYEGKNVHDIQVKVEEGRDIRGKLDLEIYKKITKP